MPIVTTETINGEIKMKDYFVRIWKNETEEGEIVHFYSIDKLWDYLQNLDKKTRFSIYNAECVLDWSGE